MKIPLVYSCSGCSAAAQMANDLAVKMDRAGTAEMSCIAGIGGDVPSLVKAAKSGRKIIVIDGCPLQCAQQCLNKHSVEPTWHFLLSDFSILKRPHADFEQEEAKKILGILTKKVTDHEPRDPIL